MVKIKDKPVIMPFGRFRGMAVKQIPNSYLRWLITVDDVPEQIREEAKLKLEESDYDNTDIEITRHALDMFSKRFLHKWTDKKIGLASFVAQMSMEALTKGKMLSDERPWGRGVKFFYDDIVWVFTWNEQLPEFKALITIMMPNKKVWERIKKEK
jgi:uncharacterized protein (DUF3820 family)